MVTKKEIEHLRELAKKQKEISTLSCMEERKKLWLSHNECASDHPVVFTDVQCVHEMIPGLLCEDEFARNLEYQMISSITLHELVDCDRVITADINIPWHMVIDEFGIRIDTHFGHDEKGRQLGYSFDYPIKDIGKDLSLLKPLSHKADKSKSYDELKRARDILGDILDVKLENQSIRWFATLSAKAFFLLGMEGMLMATYDNPDGLKALMEHLTQNTLDALLWFENEGLLTLNNGNDYAGSGSLGFSRQLPAEDYHDGMNVRLKDIWLNMNSQETLGISPDMFKEFFYPYYERIAKEAGLVYYGCCEPVDPIFKGCLENLPNLRKISVSKWANDEFMGQALRDKKIIFCKKPDPNYVGVGRDLDEEAFTKHISKTIEAAKGCTLEFSFRDIYTLSGNTRKLGDAVRIVREIIQKSW